MDKCFNKSVCRILEIAEQEMLNCHHPYVGTEHLLLALLKNNNISEICIKYNLTYKNFKKELIKVIGMASKESVNILYTPLLKIVIENASKKANKEQKELDEFYLLSSLLNEQDGIALQIVSNMGVDTESLTNEINKPSLIYQLGVSLNEKESDRVYLRDKEINEVMEILLRKNKNNPLLIGHAGVGKTAIAYELAHMIKEGNVPDKLKNKEIVLINTSTLIAGTKYRGEFELRVNNLIKEVMKCKNIILFIDEIHTIVKTGASDGSIDAANILKPYLARGDIKIIGATTYEEYNEYIKKDPALVRRFTPVMVNEPSNKDMLTIMDKVKKNYESFYDLKINKNTIKYLIDITDKYLPNLYNPDKCIEVLDTVCSKKLIDMYKDNSKNKIISNEDIYDVIKNRVNISTLREDKINELYDELKEKYNEKTVKNIVNLIKDNKFNKYMVLDGLDKNNKIKIIKYISSKFNINMININCEEYNDDYSLSKLLSNDYLYNKLEEYPFSFIVFNNYDEANKVLYNLIKTMINSGYITNSLNKKLYLNNSIIFLLNNKEESNLGFNNNLSFIPQKC
ncbi:AAA family ATPase [bacterium]|nr:AAA family ATPase [bacterium]MDY3756874.1 Clp protease N-terminal domain-containing protein [Bacilli bacterium]